MNDILQQIMNMIENTRTVPSISSFSMIGFTVLLIFGVINCILGYRLLRFWMMLCGFVIGAGIGFGAAYTGGVTEKYMYAVFMVGAGVLLAVIAFVSYKIGIFILGAGIGIGLGIYVFHPTTSLVFFFCLLLGVGLGVLAMKQAREVLIIGTSLLGGAMAGFSAAKMMTRKKSTKRMRITMDRTVLIMWISGIICHRNQKERRRKKSEEHRHRDKM